MPRSSAPTVEELAGLQALVARVAERVQEIGLRVSVWDVDGAPRSEPAFDGEFCRQFCDEKGLCADALGRLAQRACVEDASVVDQGPTGCWMLSVPLRRRRRIMAAAVACFPTRQTPESEEFARACSQAGLDSRLMASLCHSDARYDAEQAGHLCRTLRWLIEDEQSKDVAAGELDTLSTNLANTYEELSLLYRIGGAMRVNQHTHEFFGRICDELLEVVHIEAAGAVLPPRPHSGNAEEVVLVGHSPFSEDELAHLVHAHLRPQLASSTRPLVENEFSVDTDVFGPGAARVDTLIAVPLMSADTYKGMLVGINKIDGEFDTIDLKLMGSISSQAAIFLANRHLFGDLHDLLLGMLHAMTASVDAKDPYTCGHSRRVAMISRKLALLSGLDAHRAERLYLAGLLHDVGKIGMPESVLLKKGRLTQEEYETVKQHPTTGEKILGGIQQLEDIMPAILHHHERPDGRGYPDGQQRQDIPPEALIVGLADGFDAMTSSRTYRNAMPLAAVIAEIRRCSGTQFDVPLVDKFLDLDLVAFLQELREEPDSDAVGEVSL